MKLDNVRNIFLLGDLHFGTRNNSLEWFDIQKTFILDWFIESIKKNGFDPEFDILVQTGDLNHVRESTNIRISNGMLEVYDKLVETFKKGIHIILGNHDVYYKDRTDVHSLKEIDIMYDTIKVYEKPEVLTINSKHNILMYPWEHDVKVMNNKVKTFGSDYLICHADIRDFKLNKWTKLEIGLGIKELSLFKHVYSGHIHIRQEDRNVTYVGTPYQLDRGDFENIKGYYILNVEGDEITHKFIENTFSPRFIKVKAVDLLELNLSEITKIISNNFVDVLIDNKMAKIFPISRFIELLKKSKYRHIELYPTSDSTDKVDAKLNDDQDYDIFEVLSEYLNSKGTSNYMGSKITGKFKELYDNVNNDRKNYYEE